MLSSIGQEIGACNNRISWNCCNETVLTNCWLNFDFFCNYVGDEHIEGSLNSMRGKVYEVDEDGDLILTRRRSKFSFTTKTFLCNLKVVSWSTSLPTGLARDFTVFLF